MTVKSNRSKRIYNLSLLLSLLSFCLVACSVPTNLLPVGIVEVKSFSATPSTIKAGEGATLSWDVFSISEPKIILTPGDINLEKVGNLQVTPSQTTTYTLSASANGKTVSEEVTVTVEPRDEIDPTPPTNPDPENTPDAACGEGTDLVPFADANLQRAVENALGLTDAGVSCYAITLLENLAAEGTADTQITDLSGLGFAKNLQVVNLGKNTIRNLGPLAKLTSLEKVYLYQNKLSDLTPLTNLTELSILELSYNNITDITALLELPWTTPDDKVGLLENRGIPWAQIIALEKKVSEVTYSKENTDNPGEPPTLPEPPTEDDKVIEGDVLVTTQAELDALAGVTKIEGSLTIRTEAQKLDFSPLDTLQVVTKILDISENARLELVEGLPALMNVGEDEDSGAGILILRNPKLLEVNGFKNLMKLSALALVGNESLERVVGFEALASGAIAIDGNTSLEVTPDFKALASAVGYLSSVRSGIRITNNPKISAIPSFDALEIVAPLIVSNNDALTTISGFESLDIADNSDETFMTISGNDALREITGFDNATVVNGLYIENNLKL